MIVVQTNWPLCPFFLKELRFAIAYPPAPQNLPVDFANPRHRRMLLFPAALSRCTVDPVLPSPPPPYLRMQYLNWTYLWFFVLAYSPYLFDVTPAAPTIIWCEGWTMFPAFVRFQFCRGLHAQNNPSQLSGDLNQFNLVNQCRRYGRRSCFTEYVQIAVIGS